MKKQSKIEESLILYKKGKISLWKAASMADISLWKIMEIMGGKKIVVQYGKNELKKDLEGLKRD